VHLAQRLGELVEQVLLCRVDLEELVERATWPLAKVMKSV
jgi:hypothetical protein